MEAPQQSAALDMSLRTGTGNNSLALELSMVQTQDQSMRREVKTVNSSYAKDQQNLSVSRETCVSVKDQYQQQQQEKVPEHVPQHRDSSFQGQVEVRKLKFMLLSEFLTSAEIQIDEKIKTSDPLIYFFQISSKLSNTKDRKEQTWLIRRRYQDLVAFDRQVRKELKKNKLKKQLPDLPFNKEPKNQNPQDIINFLEAYLKAMITLDYICRTVAFWEFIEISDYNHEGIVKVKEGFAFKRNGGRFQPRNCFQACFTPFNIWRRRYFVITSEGIMYSYGNRQPNTKIREMLLFDHNFQLQYGKLETGRKFGIALLTTARKLVLEAKELFGFVDLIASIKDALRLSPYVDLHRYDSFAPIREKATCKWFVDGEGYYVEVLKKLREAKKEVFITDWWLSPEMYLARPVGIELNQDSRLDRVLKTIATQGVKVFILVYREPTIALNMDSNYTKTKLCSLHPNIRVMRHPSTLIPMLWSHHEKMVVVDQAVGFMGGLDICYGRWDTSGHFLTDKNKSEQFFPGIDFSNVRIKDFQDVTEFEKSDINRDTQPRMPWHDIAMMVTGEPVRDLTRHFIQYWNFAKLDIYSKDSKEKLESLVPSLDTKEKTNISSVVSAYWHRLMHKFRITKKYGESDADIAVADLTTAMMSTSSHHKPQVNITKNENFRVSASLDLNPSDILEFQQPNNQSQLKERNRRSQSIFEKPLTLKKSRFGAYVDKLKEEIVDEKENIPKKDQLPSKKLTTIVKEVDEENESSRYGSKADASHFNKALLDIDVACSVSMEKHQKRDTIENYPETFLDKSMLDDTVILQHESPRLKLQKPLRKRSNSLESHGISNDFLHELKAEQGHELTKSNLYLPILERLKQNYQESTTNASNDYYIINPDANTPTNNQKEIDFTHNNTNNTTASVIRNFTVSSIDSEKGISENRQTSGVNNKQNIKRHSVWVKSANFFKKITKIGISGGDESAEKKEQIEQDESGQVASSVDRLALDNSEFKQTGTCRCQMLRSSSSWSLGLAPSNHEMSIQLAYIDLITSSHNFIYIENQFFISSSAGSKVKNLIAAALIDRIKLAADNKQPFKVIVVMPLLPGFEGEVTDSGSAVMKCQLHWEYSTISRGGQSIIEELKAHPSIKDPSEYIEFFGLRQHSMIDDVGVTELIYVHSKLMIVDDNYVIMGSANINDRSMLGTRDSEIAMVIEDMDKITVGNRIVGKFSHSLRMSLYQEHFGLTSAQAQNPISRECTKLITDNAARNTKVYREVFACYPDDTVEQLSQLEEFQKTANLSLYDSSKDSIVGHAVQLPLNFLRKENLNFSIAQKEYFVPDENFL